MDEPMLTAGVLFKHNSRSAARQAARAARWLVERNVTVLCEVGKEVDMAPALPTEAAELAMRADFLVSLGGDGTLLYAAGLASDREVSILGIHMGSLGFLTQFAEKELTDALAGVLDEDLPVERRMRLDVTLRRDGEVVMHATALNDAVVSQSSLARLTELTLEADGRAVGSYKVDGLIVSTPTGSTAYSLAAGGPILMPRLDAFCVTPICPHALTQRPLVLPDSSRLQVTIGREAGASYLTVDGQRGHPLEPGDRVEVARSGFPLLLYRSRTRTFFDVLRSKLMWGERLGMGDAS